MTKNRLLLSLVAGLGLLWLGLWISGWWGTITLQYDQKPLTTVLQSLTRQSGLKVLTDLDPSKPITIHVRKVPLAEALEALQAAAESRGRLAFVLAPDKTGLQGILSFLPRLENNPEIKSIEYRTPFMFMTGSEDLPRWGDPRDQVWTPSPLPSPDLVALAEDAAQKSDLRILLPSAWNPKLNRSVSTGPLSSSLSSLTKAAGGTSLFVFLLPSPRPEGDARTTDNSPDRSRQRWNDGTPLPPTALAARMQSRLTGLSGEDAKMAQSSINDTVKQYQEWLALSAADKEKKIQEIMQDPNRQQRGSDRFMRGMRMMTPEQRSQRYNQYNSRREAVKDPGHTR